MAVHFLSELKTVWKRQHVNWKNVVGVQIINRFFSQMTSQYSNIYIRELGATPLQLGTVNSAAGFGRTLIALPLGYLQDRYSVRKIYLAMFSLLTLIPLFYAVATSWELVVPAILISGLGVQYSCGMICDLSLPNEDRATGKALCEGVGALPSLIAPTIAALLVTWFGGLNAKGIRPLFWIQFGVLVILFVYVALNLREVDRPKYMTEKSNILDDFREVFRRGTAVKRWLAFSSLTWFNMTMMFTYRFPYANEVKAAGPFIVGGITTAMILAEAIFSTPMGMLADRIGRKKLYYMLTPLFCAANVVFILAPSQEWLLVAGFLMGFRMLGTFAQRTMTPELVPLDLLGKWRGLISLLSGLVTIPAPIVGGLLWENLGPDWVFIMTSVIDLVVLLPLFMSVPETLKKQYNN